MPVYTPIELGPYLPNGSTAISIERPDCMVGLAQPPKVVGTPLECCDCKHPMRRHFVCSKLMFRVGVFFVSI